MAVGIEMETVRSRSLRHKGITSGFDYMRLGLALGIIAFHSVGVCYGSDTLLWERYRSIFGSLLPMFFALSGYLVTGSLIRNPDLPKFLTLRGIRILPALAVEIALSAFIIGPLVTTWALTDYFTSFRFFRYLMNVVGRISFDLPGVFETNPLTAVNNSLWTIPYELDCYLVLAVALVIGLFSRPRLMLLIAMAIVVIMSALGYMQLSVFQGLRPTGELLVVAFVFGVLFNTLGDRIPLHPILFVVAVLATIVLLTDVRNSYLALIPQTYVTVYLGLCNPAKRTFLMRGDYSYGLYLFAYPIQQCYIVLFPDHKIWWLNTVFAVGLGLIYAFFSWHVIEKPVLARRARVVTFVERLLTVIGRKRSVVRS